MSNTSLTTLTQKIDALRAKGFSDEEINEILASNTSTNAVQNTEENKEFVEQWNQRVDDVHKYEWLGFIIGAVLLLPFFFTIHSGTKFPIYWLGFVCVIFAFFSFFQSNRIKEFFKKRPQ